MWVKLLNNIVASGDHPVLASIHLVYVRIPGKGIDTNGLAYI
jgi:hypothetical protein